MFCGNCGKPMVDGNCTSCGNAQNTANNQQQVNTQQVNTQQVNASPNMANAMGNIKNLPTNTLIGMGVVGVAVLLVIIFVFSMLSSGVDKLADEYLEVYLTYDGAAAVAMIHKDIVEEAMYESRLDEDEFEEALSDSMYYYVNRVASYIDVSTKKISDYVTIDDIEIEELSARDFDDLEDEYLDYADVKIKDARRVTYELYFKSDDGKTEAEHEVYFVKIGSSWYIDPVNSNFYMSYNR